MIEKCEKSGLSNEAKNIYFVLIKINRIELQFFGRDLVPTLSKMICPLIENV